MNHIYIHVYHGNTHDIFPYTSEWAANIMAQEYFKCPDVSRVTIVNTETGGIIYDRKKEVTK